ncbi:MAG: hypothetical protein KGZ50_05440 [Peptococcaceae bacterium]|nr:hypothetical protein [Peptococcaceae bacterium]
MRDQVQQLGHFGLECVMGAHGFLVTVDGLGVLGVCALWAQLFASLGLAGGFQVAGGCWLGYGTGRWLAWGALGQGVGWLGPGLAGAAGLIPSAARPKIGQQPLPAPDPP